MKTVRSTVKAHGAAVAVAALVVGLTIGSARSALCADPVTDDNVDAAVAAAKTVDDHQTLAAYFTTKSQQALANAARHKKMANAFSGKPATSWEAHCQALVRTFQEQAKEYAALAREQEAIVKAMQHAR